MRIEWTPYLSVGIDEIDSHQKDLFAAAESVVAAARGSDRELETLVRRLIEVANAQFAAEERWMRAASAPAIVRHAHEHRRFVEDLTAVADQLARGERAAVDALDLARFVPTWISSHVSGSDRDLARLARTQRVSA